MRDEPKVLSGPETQTPVVREPQPAASDDPAAAAFEELRKEVALIHRAVAGLAAERAAPFPDYSETLSAIVQASRVTAQRLKTIMELSALSITPEQTGRQIAAAAETARRADHAALENTRSSLQNVTQEMTTVLGSARTAKRQRIWLTATGGVSFTAGVILWTVIAGRADRTLPIDHRSPETKAAAILGMDEVTAGEHLIQTTSPKLWQDIVLGDRVVITNRKVLEICRRKAGKQPVRCVIQVPADQP